MEITHISHAGPFQYIKDFTGKKWYFEMHRYCGPVDLKKNGDPKVNQFKEKSSFWPAFQLWMNQGQNVVDGYCQYSRGK